MFEAADNAATGLGTVSLVGHTRFGDRKEDLSSVAGAATTGQDMTRPTQAGGMVWPPGAAVADRRAGPAVPRFPRRRPGRARTLDPDRQAGEPGRAPRATSSTSR